MSGTPFLADCGPAGLGIIDGIDGAFVACDALNEETPHCDSVNPLDVSTESCLDLAPQSSDDLTCAGEQGQGEI